MSNPIIGMSYFIAGFGLMTKPGLKRFIIIPSLINILFFVGLFFLLRHYVAIFNHWFDHFLPTWLHWLANFLWLLFFIGFFLVFIYFFVTISNFISAPFNSLLSEKVELYLTGKTLKSQSLFENIKDIPRILGRQLAILGYYLPRALLLLLLFFVPIVQAFAAFFWFLFNGWLMAMTYVDYPTDNHRIPLSDVQLFLKQRSLTTFGFGLSVLFATMVPFLNFFAIPAAVAGATKFWVEESSGVGKKITH